MNHADIPEPDLSASHDNGLCQDGNLIQVMKKEQLYQKKANFSRSPNISPYGFAPEK